MILVKYLKKLLTINTYGKLRDLKGYLNQESYCTSISSKKHFWFLDAPDYGNIGDQAIAYATKLFLSENYSEFDIIEIQQSQIIKYLNWLKNNINESDIIVLQGGGNFGNLYPPYEAVRRKIVQTFSNNKIIIFPQSVYYTNDKKGNYEIKVAKKIYNKDNIVIFAREKNSYNRLKALFPNVEVGLCPDIVFYLYGRINVEKKNGLGICLRNDSEKIEFNENQVCFIDNKIKCYKNINYIDTICSNNNINSQNREQIVYNKIMEFAVNELVLTDRLHGMIFSFISKTPCVFFPSKTGKASFIYETWLSNSNMISDYKEPQSEIIEEDYTFDFTVLKNAISRN